MFKLLVLAVFVVAFIVENEAQNPGFMNEHDLVMRSFMMQQNPSLFSQGGFGAKPEGAGEGGKGGGKGKGKGKGKGEEKGKGKGKGKGKDKENSDAESTE